MKIIVISSLLIAQASAFAAAPIRYRCEVRVQDQQSMPNQFEIKGAFFLDGKLNSRFLIDANAVVTRTKVITGAGLEDFNWNTKEPFFSMRLYAFDFLNGADNIKTSIAAGYRKGGLDQTQSTAESDAAVPAKNIVSSGSSSSIGYSHYSVNCRLVD
ncbi:MAG: hypothetical protein ACXWQO_13265 [Bdellovibrionota bacterium]